MNKNNSKPTIRLILGVGVCLAAAGTPGDGQAGSGTVTLWLDDTTNTIGAASFCETQSNDQNGDGNGNNGQSDDSNDANGDGNGNNGQGGRQVCLLGVGGGDSGGSGGGDSGGSSGGSGGDSGGGSGGGSSGGSSGGSGGSSGGGGKKK